MAAVAAPRTLTRRRSLPGGRAVVGGLLVTASAVGLFAASGAASDGPRAAYVVATHDIGAGQRFGPDDLALVRLDLPTRQRSRSYTSIGTLVPAFFALLSLVAPPRVRAVTFTTIIVFAIPGVSIFLPLIGKMADEFGVRTSMLAMVPITLAAGFVLSSASKFVMDDISRAFQPIPA